MTHTQSRRKLLRTLAGVTAVAAGVGSAGWFVQRQAQPFTVTVPNPPDIDNFDERTMAVLMSLVKAVFINYPPRSLDHYQTHLQWRANHVDGYAAYYARVAVKLHEQAMSQFGQGFVIASLNDRRALIDDDLAQYVESSSNLPIEGNDTRALLSDLLRYYMHTDAYLLVGYDRWPEVPQGLTSYREAMGSV